MSNKHPFQKTLVLALYAAGGILLVAGLVFGLFAQPVLANDASGTVLPLIICATHNPDGTFTAIWGYDNQTSKTQTIPVGDDNYISPKPKNRQQPTTFKTGKHTDVFETVFTEDEVIKWTLVGPDGKNHTAQASDSTPRCKAAQVNPTPTTRVPATTQPTSPAAAIVTATPSEVVQPTNEPLPTTTTAPTATAGATSIPLPTATTQPVVAATATPVTAATTAPRMTATSNPRPVAAAPTGTPAVAGTPAISGAAATTTATSTLLPTLPPPAAQSTNAVAAVTGIDLAGAQASSAALPRLLIDLGAALLGLAIIGNILLIRK